MRYAELHCKSNFSFLEGASFADELVQQAVDLKLHALAVTDRNSLAGVVRAHVAAKKAELKLLIGAEIVPADCAPVLLYATDRASYGRLARLITGGRRHAEKGSCNISLSDVLAHSEGLIAVAIPPHDVQLWERWGTQSVQALREAFDQRLYAAIEVHRGQRDAERITTLRAFSKRSAIPLVAANDVHYHERQRRRLQDVLVCIREGCTLAAAGYRLFPNGERHLKSAEQMLELFGPEGAEWIERSVEIADACKFKLDELRYEYPEELTPPGKTPTEHLAELTWAGAHWRWPDGISEKFRAQINHELELIRKMRYETYFLTVHDLVIYARSRDILCQGRGSAANSIVCYCLAITSVDPERSDLLFERFISCERNEPPDIDVDFEHERREEVMQYVYDKYGRERAGIVAEVISYRPKSAARDVGKALGMSLDLVEKLADMMDSYGNSASMSQGIREAGVNPGERMMRDFSELSGEILGFPRHLSQHVGGFVITQGPLCELVPIENATMKDRTVIEWDKDDIDALGMLKVDCLALGMLTCIHRCFDLIRKHHGRELTLATVPAEDPAVYDMCCKADTIGVFQIESRAQMSMLPRLRPRTYYDLVIEVSIVRPGPIQGGMVHPYLRRRAGEEPIEYKNEKLKEVLGKTLGVPLFQEQVMKLASVAAGFSPGEADQLRRSMAAWRRSGVIEKHHEKFVSGMIKNGYDLSFAEAVFNQIKGFGEYGFPESHAASFALLVYASAWIKLHYPAEFLAGLLNSQPMGFYAPAQLVRDAQNHNITVLPVDINHSGWESHLESDRVVRLGFKQARGISPDRHIQPLLQARQRPFQSIADLARRSGLTQAALAALAKADAFRSIGLDRRAALWQVLNQYAELPLFKDVDIEESEPNLNAMPLQEHVAADYSHTGLSLKAHPVSFVREALQRVDALPCETLRITNDGAWVCVAGIVLVRQRPETAAGVVFITLEDETGQANVIVWPAVFDRFYRAARGAAGLIIHGKLQRQNEVIHVVAQRISDLRELIPELKHQSRDFH